MQSPEGLEDSPFNSVPPYENSTTRNAIISSNYLRCNELLHVIKKRKFLDKQLPTFHFLGHLQNVLTRFITHFF